MPRQTSMQLTPDTERKVADLIEWGYGTRSDIIRLAISKFYDSEVAVKLALERMRKEEKGEEVMMDVFHYGPPEPEPYICPRCGEEHLNDGQKPSCLPRTEAEKLLERIGALEARVLELEIWNRAMHGVNLGEMP